ncbi:amidohydrolase [Rhodococcus sp. SORGH_AS_0301]|uniref:amidohydrolase n=1 Tax=Rhodococcus sp. SORGH_AS_0301 TaxID=3041780 RepID=UPI00277E24A7|nr:amidohydrolase [Rhodococcus sp. SORGH_AS_0301]MDQ1180462.1 putative amidohydrolase YtcJ [Rhodococcus sp. SORGH_AS_0301]
MSTQLLVGGRIYSPSAPDATAMAVTDGTVVWIGEDRPARALHPDAEVVELNGEFVTPAFVDTHVHTTATGLALIGLDLSGARSLDECLRALAAYAAEDGGTLIWGQNWDESTWPEGRGPTTAELDAAAPGRAVYLSRIDAHSAACSTVLRRAAGDVVATADPQRPLIAEAHHAVRTRALDLLSPAGRHRARVAALDHAAAHGVAAVHECAGPDISGRVDLAELLALEHGVEVRAYWGEAVSTPDEATALLAATGAHALGGDLFVDGSIGSHTAWLHDHYADHSGCGRSYLDVDAIAAHVSACTRAGIQAGFHVIGDAATTAVVEAFGRVVAELGGPAVASRGHRLEHIEMVSSEQADALAAWGVIASVQPVFDTYWGGEEGLYATRLGAERARALNPLAMMASAGVSLAIGSDAPVTPLEPWRGVRGAVNHRTPGSAVSPRAAFSAATRGAWRAGGVRDGLAGTLVPGAPASYAVWDAAELVVSAPRDSVQRWSTDPRSRVPALPRLDPEAPDPVCLETVHRGATVYRA